MVLRNILLCDINNNTKSIIIDKKNIVINELKYIIQNIYNLPIIHQILYYNNKYLHNKKILNIENGMIIRLSLRLLGGKGGFGSLLKGSGKNAGKKTTDFSSCRDLSGRRVRHVETEKLMNQSQSNMNVMDEKTKQEKFKAIRDGIDVRSCKYGDECKRKDIDCRRLHPNKNKKKKRPLSAVFGDDSEPIEDTADECKESIKDALKFGLKNAMLKKRKLVSLSSSNHTNSNGNHANSNGNHINHSNSNISNNNSNNNITIEDLNSKKIDEKQSMSHNNSNNNATKNDNTDDDINKHIKDDNNNNKKKQVDGKKSKELNNFDSIDLKHINNAQELESYGLDHIKAELIRQRLKCGGTLQQRCERLFLLKNTEYDNLPNKVKVFAKNKK